MPFAIGSTAKGSMPTCPPATSDRQGGGAYAGTAHLSCGCECARPHCSESAADPHCLAFDSHSFCAKSHKHTHPHHTVQAGGWCQGWAWVSPTPCVRACLPRVQLQTGRGVQQPVRVRYPDGSRRRSRSELPPFGPWRQRANLGGIRGPVFVVVDRNCHQLQSRGRGVGLICLC